MKVLTMSSVATSVRSPPLHELSSGPRTGQVNAIQRSGMGGTTSGYSEGDSSAEESKKSRTRQLCLT